MPHHSNPEKTGVRVGLLIMLAGVVMLLLPSLTGMEGMSGGFALRFVGLFVVICGLVTWLLYRGRAALLDRILADQGLLAHWTHDADAARRNAERAYAEQRHMHRDLFLLTAGMLLVAGFFVLILPMLRGEDLIGGGVLLYFALIPLLGGIAWLTPRLAYRRALQAGGDIYIAQGGAYVAGALHAWSLPFTRLERVHVQRKGEERVLEIDIGNLTRLGWVRYQTTTLKVPVPAGQEAQAEEVARALTGQMKR